MDGFGRSRNTCVMALDNIFWMDFVGLAVCAKRLNNKIYNTMMMDMMVMMVMMIIT